MLQRLRIRNFKSIYDETIELGRFNVFIGENGSGKTNVLEALGMASAASENKLSTDELALSGIRVAKPTIPFSSFLKEKQVKAIDLELLIKTEDNLNVNISNQLTTENINDIFSKWTLKDGILSIEDEGKPISLVPYYESILQTNTFDFLTRAFLPLMRNYSTPEKLQRFLIEQVNTLLPKTFIRSIQLDLYKIYNLSTQTLRGIDGKSRAIPGIQGENLDRLIESFDKKERELLEEYAYFIDWLEKIEIDKEDRHKSDGHKLDMSTSILYFRDKYMQRKNNRFSAENANEGVLHILFYLALFISRHTSKFFAIDNIETALNPELCKKLVEQLVKLSTKTNRQVLITTHSPSVLDGLNLYDDEQRLFKVYRNKKGHTKVKRIQLKPNQEFNGQQFKLSELWMRNYIGGIPQNL